MRILKRLLRFVRRQPIVLVDLDAELEQAELTYGRGNYQR